MQLAPLLSAFMFSIFALVGCSNSQEENGSDADSNLYDPHDAAEVCASMKSKPACRAVRFDQYPDGISQCYWGTVAELYELYGSERVIGADGQIIDPPMPAEGGAGGDEGAVTDEAGCYVVEGDGG